MPIQAKHIQALTAHSVAIVAHHNAIEAVLATVQPEVTRLQGLQAQEMADREVLFEKIFSEVVVEDLFDSTHARILYSLGWNLGTGNPAFTSFWTRVVAGTYISQWSRWSVGENSNDDAVKEPEVILPIELDAATLERTAEILEGLYSTARELRPSVVIRLQAEPHGYALRPRGTTWELLHREKVQATFDTLLSALQQAPSATF